MGRAENGEDTGIAIGIVERGVNGVAWHKNRITATEDVFFALQPLFDLAVEHVNDFLLMWVRVKTVEFAGVEPRLNHDDIAAIGLDWRAKPGDITGVMRFAGERCAELKPAFCF